MAAAGRVETPYRLTPQMVFRIGILGFLALAAFGVLIFRLWALQVLSGAQHLRAAENNQLRMMRIDEELAGLLGKLELAAVFLEKFGGDSLVEIRRNVEGYLQQVRDY